MPRLLRSFPEGGRLCFACRWVRLHLDLPLAPVFPVRLCPLPSPLYAVLLGYKESPVAEARHRFAPMVRSAVRRLPGRPRPLHHRGRRRSRRPRAPGALDGPTHGGAARCARRAGQHRPDPPSRRPLVAGPPSSHPGDPWATCDRTQAPSRFPRRSAGPWAAGPPSCSTTPMSAALGLRVQRPPCVAPAHAGS